jgi:hypothetical protein
MVGRGIGPDPLTRVREASDFSPRGRSGTDISAGNGRQCPHTGGVTGDFIRGEDVGSEAGPGAIEPLLLDDLESVGDRFVHHLGMGVLVFAVGIDESGLLKLRDPPVWIIQGQVSRFAEHSVCLCQHVIGPDNAHVLDGLTQVHQVERMWPDPAQIGHRGVAVAHDSLGRLDAIVLRPIPVDLVASLGRKIHAHRFVEMVRIAEGGDEGCFGRLKARASEIEVPSRRLQVLHRH